MKTKQWIGALAFVLLTATTQFSCDSKKENKAEEVSDQKEDVIEAQAEGDTSKVREEQTELDTARKEYRDAVKEEKKDQKDSER